MQLPFFGPSREGAKAPSYRRGGGSVVVWTYLWSPVLIPDCDAALGGGARLTHDCFP
jgi:hypothetical protein